MLAIITCFESTTEAQSIGLYRSIARYASYPSGLTVFGVAPRAGFAPGKAAVAEAERHGVRLVEADLNAAFAHYPLANKPISCRHVARAHSADAYLFLDSDTLFLHAIDLGLVGGADAAVRPVAQRNIGIASFEEENGAYWRAMYDYLGAEPSRRVAPAFGDIEILEYYNSGFVLVRDASIFESWASLTEHLLRTEAQPMAGPYFVEQSALSAAITAHARAVAPLPKDVNYPLPLHSRLPSRSQVENLAEVRHVHYHKHFADKDARRAAALQAGFGEKAEAIEALLAW